MAGTTGLEPAASAVTALREVVEPLIDVVNVEGGDFHQVPFRGSSSLPRGF
jgi:hypothetical protein